MFSRAVAVITVTLKPAWLRQGQIRISTERLVVDASVADPFVDNLAKRVAALTVGDPREEAVLGLLVNAAAGKRMEAPAASAATCMARVTARFHQKRERPR
jgi:acyl-CoA reductase-like NAD-dependent aldehyde dehydrogenase